jgi:hypothetical protein
LARSKSSPFQVLFAKSAQQFIDGTFKRWAIVLHDLKHSMNVDAEVLMGD